jgi:hypothetical protein
MMKRWKKQHSHTLAFLGLFEETGMDDSEYNNLNTLF